MLKLVVSSSVHRPPSGDTPAESSADDDRFDKAFVRYVRYVAAIARAVLGDVPEVEDVVQETFLKALTNWERCREDRKAWLGTIARNTALSRLRAIGVRATAADAVAGSMPGEVQPVEKDVGTHRLQEAFGHLEDYEAQLLKLRYGHDLTNREIGKHVKRSASSVSTRAKAALKLLKKVLTSKGGNS
jgi:RNA polymerase sigma factor (sigma-70 family)